MVYISETAGKTVYFYKIYLLILNLNPGKIIILIYAHPILLSIEYILLYRGIPKEVVIKLT